VRRISKTLGSPENPGPVPKVPKVPPEPPLNALVYLYIIHLQNVDYSIIILFFILSLLVYVKLNKIVQ